MFKSIDAQDIDIILAPYADNSIVFRADPENSDIILQILKSSFDESDLTFYNLQIDLEKTYKSILDKLIGDASMSNDIKNVYYSSELFIATKSTIWLTFYNFLQPCHIVPELDQMKSKVFDSLALKYYQFRMILLDDKRKSASKFFYNWTILSVALFFNIILEEFPDSPFYQNSAFIERAETVTQELLIGFKPEDASFHEKVLEFIPDPIFFRAKRLPNFNAHQQILNDIIGNEIHHQNQLANRNRILFTSRDNNPLLARALELRSFKNKTTDSKISTRNIMMNKTGPSTSRDFVLDAKLCKENSERARRAHMQNIQSNLRQICSKEANLVLSIEQNAVLCKRVLKNRLQAKEVIDGIEERQKSRKTGKPYKKNDVYDEEEKHS